MIKSETLFSNLFFVKYSIEKLIMNALKNIYSLNFYLIQNVQITSLRLNNTFKKKC